MDTPHYLNVAAPLQYIKDNWRVWNYCKSGLTRELRLREDKDHVIRCPCTYNISNTLTFNPLKGRDVNWLYFAIQV